MLGLSNESIQKENSSKEKKEENSIDKKAREIGEELFYLLTYP